MRHGVLGEEKRLSDRRRQRNGKVLHPYVMPWEAAGAHPPTAYSSMRGSWRGAVSLMALALCPAGVTAAAADQGHSDAAKAWKNVLRSAASTAAGARGAKGELAARENSLRQDARRSSSLIRP